jgi:hypothetical protein
MSDVLLFLVEQTIDEPVERRLVLGEPLPFEIESVFARLRPAALPPVLKPVGERLHVGLLGGGKAGIEHLRLGAQTLLLALDALGLGVEGRDRLPAATGS